MKSNAELAEMMGANTSEAEALAMSQILTELGVTPDYLSDSEFFALIPKAIQRASANATAPVGSGVWVHPTTGLTYRPHDRATEYQECRFCGLRLGACIETEHDATYYADDWDTSVCPACGAADAMWIPTYDA